MTDHAYGSGTYGGGTYGGVTVTAAPTWLVQVLDPVAGWVDRTCDVRSIDVDAGRSTYVDAFDASSLTVVFANFAGIYSTWPPDSIWRQPSGFVGGVPIRAGSIVNGAVAWRFTGTTDAVVDAWPGTVDAVATVTASDGMKGLARRQGLARAAVGAGELSGARVNRLATDAGWSGPRRIDAGVVAMQATTLEGVTVDLMRQVGESEWGWLYVDGDGALTFRQRDAAATDPRMSTAQYVFTDDDAIAGACYSDGTALAADESHVLNVAQVTPPGVATQTYEDAPSKAWFGPRTWTRTDLPILNAADALTLAQLVVAYYKSSDRRVDAVTFDAAHRPGNVAAAHGARITDRIRFIRHLPGGYQLDADLLVHGRSDTVTPAGDGATLAAWDVTIKTGSALTIRDLAAWDAAGWDANQWGL